MRHNTREGVWGVYEVMPGKECGVCVTLCPGGSVGWVCVT